MAFFIFWLTHQIHWFMTTNTAWLLLLLLSYATPQQEEESLSELSQEHVLCRSLYKVEDISRFLFAQSLPEGLVPSSDKIGYNTSETLKWLKILRRHKSLDGNGLQNFCVLLLLLCVDECWRLPCAYWPGLVCKVTLQIHEQTDTDRGWGELE